jgi:monoterpene epsilon-lactone hydrolase
MKATSQLVVGIVLAFAVQAWKFSLPRAPVAVGRVVLRWVFRVGGPFASSEGGAWVTPGDHAPPSGQLALYQNLVAGHESSDHVGCIGGKLSEIGIRIWDSSFGSPGVTMMLGVVPSSCEKKAAGFPGQSLWLDSNMRKPLENDAPVIVYCHGGGGIIGSPHVDKGFPFNLNRQTGIRVLSLDYPLAPAHRAPAAGGAVADAVAKLGPSRKVILVGMSGGAYPVLQSVLDHGVQPAGVVLVSGMVAGRADLPSHSKHVDKDIFSHAWVACMQEASYASGSETLLDKDWSPFASVPTFVHASANEVFTDDALEATRRIRAVGGNATLDLVPHAPHGVVLFVELIPEADAAMQRLATWIKSVARV